MIKDDDSFTDNDVLCSIFRKYLDKTPEAEEILKVVSLPYITEKDLLRIIDYIPIVVDREFIARFILSGQERIRGEKERKPPRKELNGRDLSL